MNLEKTKWTQLHIDTTTTPWTTYICVSYIWTALTDSKWRIIKVDADWNVYFPKDTVRGIVSDRMEFLPWSISSYTFTYNY